MKYRIKIEIIEDQSGEKPHYEIKDVYEQTVNKLDLWEVIRAVNLGKEWKEIKIP